MRRLCLLTVIFLTAAVSGSGAPSDAAPGTSANPPAATDLQIAFHKVRQDVAVAGILRDLRDRARHDLAVFRNVRVVDPAAATVSPKQSVIVSEGRIAWVGDMEKEPKLQNAFVIDGGGRFASPGLTDMHVHTGPADGWLLDLSAGVTAVRDMAGFPWMLAARDMIHANRMLAPNLDVAAPLINAFPLEGYAVVPADPEDARRIVRQEAACGYEFVKIHNIVPLPIFDAVAEQAKSLGMDLIGHVPHDIPIRHAVEAGMRTMEHLKGFINDATLKAGETDFAAGVGPDVWNTPTLYAGRGYARGDAARALLAEPEMRFAPLRRKASWESTIDRPGDHAQQAGLEAQSIMKDIVGKLHAAHAQFLAGTDADNYPYQVMGYALVEEIRLLQGAGLSPAEALRAATIDPARAMREPEEFGRIAKRLRADVVLLDANPLENVAAYESNRGVMAHGFWLSRELLDPALDRLAAIEAEPDAGVDVTAETVAKLAADVKAQADDGFAFSAVRLSNLAGLVRTGNAAAADQLERIAQERNTGACAMYRP